MADLRVLDGCKLKWRLPEDAVADDVLIPALRNAEHFDCMVGFFGGQALRQLAPGLAAFLSNGSNPIRLLVSPMLSEQDLAGIRIGMSTPEEILADAVGASLRDAMALEDALTHHTLHCLAYLLAAKRLQIKIVMIEGGIFHVKEWILRSGDDLAVLAGSANFTGRAMRSNIESLYLHRSWRDIDNLDTCTESLVEFELLWSGRKFGARTIDLPTALSENLVRTYDPTVPPTEDDFNRAAEQSMDVRVSQDSTGTFIVPEHLDVWDGAFAHQGQAITAWEEADCRGVLALATGAGKTISALVAAHRLQAAGGQLAIVVAVPTTPLVAQWALECEEFGLRPVVAPPMHRKKRLRAIQHALDNLTFGVTQVEAIIVTNDGLVDSDFEELMDSYEGEALLIADEVHNLGGVKAFVASPPLWPTSRLGLSATPERQYDEQGTEAVFDYFGDTVYTFTLEDAIGVCLVPYDYHLHRVELQAQEIEDYADLTEEIRRRVAMGSDIYDGDDLTLTILLNKRRLILETANGKLSKLGELLDSLPAKDVRRTLFYATDKHPGQLREINSMLHNRRIRAHQITEAETRRGHLLSATLSAFSAGVLQALTAKRVLDEGINVPQIDTAFILASTTVRKQWVQRRGRVLRTSASTGKTHAVIHDFVVIPPGGGPYDETERKLVEAELARCDEFARLARNRASGSGPLYVINDTRTQFLT